ncbi:MAG: class I SAM-dependent methyltransferase [Thermoanaerobaculia bacterium]|nr:class I SAM-dependent methyltransferase [Thermoanaerobaculia bacterium]
MSPTSRATRLLRSLYRAGLRAVERGVHRLGLAYARAGDFYSPLPLRERLERTRARWDRPSELSGVDLDVAAQGALLGRLAQRHGAELATLPPFAELKRAGFGPGFTEVDAAVSYLVLRALRPRRYVEIGSGLSTAVAALAAERNAAEGAPCAITAVDPFPARPLAARRDLELVACEVQDLGPEWFARLEAGDVLFIDSSHVVRIDGDVPHLYLEVVPRLAPGVVLHAHDIPWPRLAPHPAETYVTRAKWPMFWTEAMLLTALLAFNREFRPLLSTSLLRHHDEDLLAARLPGYRKLDPPDHDTHAGSLWWCRLPVPPPLAGAAAAPGPP